MNARSTNGSDGRDRRGRFARGNPGGPGNPYARKVAQLRAALMKSVSAQDVREIVQRLVVTAKAGDLGAAKLLLERLLGPAVAADIEERLASLEGTLTEKENQVWPGRPG